MFEKVLLVPADFHLFISRGIMVGQGCTSKTCKAGYRLLDFLAAGEKI